MPPAAAYAHDSTRLSLWPSQAGTGAVIFDAAIGTPPETAGRLARAAACLAAWVAIGTSRSAA
jgi:hypothetical protein